MTSEDADAGAEPKRRPRRRRRARGQDSDVPKAAGETPVAASSDAEAGAFLEPPPLAAGGGDEPETKPRVRRKRGRPRRARGARDEVASAESAAAAEEAAEAAEASEGGGAEPTAPPRKTRRRKRARRRSTSEDASANADASADANADAPDDAASRAEADDGEVAPARKARRRKRSRRRTSAADPEGRADAPTDPADEDAIPPLPDDENDPVDGEAVGRRGRSRSRGGRRGGKGKSKAGGKSTRAKSSGEKGSREKRGGREHKDKRESRDKRSRRDGRRGDRRQRDPRAIDIVPRASSVEDGTTEKVLLVNARDRDEARIALMVGGRLEEVYIESAAAERSSAGHVYRGRVQNVERGIGAAFVDLGRGLTGFLHASDLPLGEGDDPHAAVTDRIKPGDEVVVQITRDSIGRKGPALTGKISFPGRYLVLMPFAARSGISRRIPQGSERDRVRKLLRKLAVPEGMGVIVRTSSETTDLAALAADLEHLLKGWEFIKRKAAEPGQPGLLRGESDLAERSVRDIMPGDVTRIVVDKDDIAGRIHRLLRVWYPSAAEAADEAAHASVRAVTAALDTPIGELEVHGAGAGRSAGEALEAPAGAEEAAPEPSAEVPEEASAADTPETDVESAQGSRSEAGSEAGPEAADEAAADEAAADDPAADAALEPEGEDGEVRGERDDGDDEEDAPDDELDDEDDDELDDDGLGDEEDTEGVEEVEAGGDAGTDDDEEVVKETPVERLARLQQVARAMPEVELHTDAIPLFHKYGAETQLEDAFRRSTRLPSGGSIVIDQTEALVAVDVNSGRLTDEADPESTALVTNLEAVEETAHQLRLRDLGGLVVIDFIDMRERKSRRKVELALRDALAGDRARIRMGRMGPFGLVVLSRQRIRQALSRVTHEACVDCAGTGRRRQISGLGLRVVREMQARVARSRGRGGLEVRAPQEVIAWIKKHRGHDVKQLKKACSGPVTLEADGRLAVDGWAMKGLASTTPEEE